MSCIELTIHAGGHDRRNCPVSFTLPDGAPPAPLVLRTEDGVVLPCQRSDQTPATVTFILDRLDAGAVRKAVIESGTPSAACAVQLDHIAGERVDISVGRRLFSSYHYASRWARPFMMPLNGPGGNTVTRSFSPPDAAPTGTDHLHHKSLFVAWGDVNGCDNWSEGEGHGRQEHQAFAALESGPVFGRIEATNRWVANDGAPLLDEHRCVTVYGLPDDSRLLDLSVRFVAPYGPVNFGDTKEGGIASIRVAPEMNAAKDGKIVNAYGGTQEGETWGKRAHWCDYSGPVAGVTAGIAIFDNPANFRYPTYWHVRNYGLMTANPFGLSHFTGDAKNNGSHAIPKDAVFTFRYRLYVHAGNTADAGVSGKFLDYVAPPTVVLG